MRNTILITLVLLSGLNMISAQVNSVNLTLKGEGLKGLYQNASSNEYQNCTVNTEGTSLKAKIRVRGDSSREYDKKSLKVKYKKGKQDVILNLNAEYKDPSYMHQHVATKIFKNEGVPVFETNHTLLTVNDNFQGIYLQVENIGKDFLLKNNLDPYGNLYKAKKDGSNLSVYDDVHYRWEKKTNTNGDKSDLYSLIKTINQVPDSGFLNFVKAEFDYHNLLTVFAVNTLIGNGSTYYHNYYLFHDINGSGKWKMIPWDLDKSMGSYNEKLPYYYSSWSHLESGAMPENPLFQRLLLDEKGLKDFKKRIREIVKSSFNIKHLSPEIEKVKKELKEHIENDKSDVVKDVPAWEKSIKKMEAYIKKRPKELEKQWKEYPSVFKLNNRIGYQFDRVAKVSWQKSKSSLESEVTYSVKVSKSKTFKKEVLEFKGLTKNRLSIDSLKPGRYYWHVVASNGKHKVSGFNCRSYFDVGKAVILGGKISGKKVIKNTEVVIFKNLVIKKGASLEFSDNVKVYFSKNARIINHGTLKINGRKDQPVIFKNRKQNAGWKGVLSKGKLEINYAEFYGVIGESVVRQVDGSAVMNNTLSKYCNVREIASFNKCPAEVKNNIVEACDGEGILFLRCSGIVKHNILNNIPDALEATYCKDLTITENILIGSPDDGIDVNYGENIEVSYNVAINCEDKGYSITADPKHKTIFFKNNYSEGCNRGIGVEGKGEIILSGNIYFNNKTQLFLENIKGLTVSSINEVFSDVKTINKHVTVTGEQIVQTKYGGEKGLEVKLDQKDNRLNKIEILSTDSLPINLKGVEIKSGKRTLKKFLKNCVVFPSGKVVLLDTQKKKSVDKLVFNKTKKPKKINLIVDGSKRKVKGKFNSSSNSFLLIGIGGLFAVLAVFFMLKKRKNA